MFKKVFFSETVSKKKKLPTGKQQKAQNIFLGLVLLDIVTILLLNLNHFICNTLQSFLAQLSRRLIGELIVYFPIFQALVVRLLTF